MRGGTGAFRSNSLLHGHSFIFCLPRSNKVTKLHTPFTTPAIKHCHTGTSWVPMLSRGSIASSVSPLPDPTPASLGYQPPPFPHTSRSPSHTLNWSQRNGAVKAAYNCPCLQKPCYSSALSCVLLFPFWVLTEICHHFATPSPLPLTQTLNCSLNYFYSMSSMLFSQVLLLANQIYKKVATSKKEGVLQGESFKKN